jgi:hypothetical protein
MSRTLLPDLRPGLESVAPIPNKTSSWAEDDVDR